LRGRSPPGRHRGRGAAHRVCREWAARHPCAGLVRRGRLDRWRGPRPRPVPGSAGRAHELTLPRAAGKRGAYWHLRAMAADRSGEHAARVLPSAASSQRASRYATSPMVAPYGVRRVHLGGVTQTLVVVAMVAATILLLLSTTNALGATLVTPKCDNVNLRT